MTLPLALNDPSYHYLLSSTPSTTWYLCHAKTDNFTICLAQDELQDLILGAILHTMPTSKSKGTCLSPSLLIPTPDARFNAAHIKIVGPLLSSQGYTYLLTSVDHYTHWPEATQISTITSEAIAQVFISGCISRSSTILTNLGRQFKSQLWNNIMALLRIKRSPTTSYQPQSNGIIEPFHHQPKDALKPQPNPGDWI